MQNIISNDQKTKTKKGVEDNYFTIDLPLSILLLLAFSPILLTNFLIAKTCSMPAMKIYKKTDCLGRIVVLHRCQCGVAKDLGLLWSIVLQNISFCGLPLQDAFSELEKRELKSFEDCRAGLFSLINLHKLSGMSVDNSFNLIKQQLSSGRLAYASLIAKSVFAKLFFRKPKTKLQQPKEYKLFGLTIHNDSMESAIDWIIDPSFSNNENRNCKVAYFINVNSINIAAKNALLRTQINKADRCFADGSGMRIAAKHVGLRINENINGTDLLPHLCQALQETKQSIYMLGAKPGVAAKAAQKLLDIYPNLTIAGTQDGYFHDDNVESVIADINESKADILLVAMGTPVQEEWLYKHAPQLHCTSALAVGGLFDFYSGNIPRAPMWMRELGLEWVWRLLQEPQTKFNRYVIGNPVFLIQTFLFQRAKRGF